MRECSKSIVRRLSDPNFINKYFVGHGLDIGGKPDPLSMYQGLFSRCLSVRTWDLEDGDGQFLQGVPNESFDFIHSSHCLEHLVDPVEGLKNWLRVIRQGGYLIITVPDEDLYEQGVFPSNLNGDHKWTFTIYKPTSWSSRSLNLIDVVRELGLTAEVLRIEQLNSTYRFDFPRLDQTLTPIGECGIELIIRKRNESELNDKGRWRRSDETLTSDKKIHFNRYKDDNNMIRLGRFMPKPLLWLMRNLVDKLESLSQRIHRAKMKY